MGSGQHIQRDLLAAGGALDGAAVHDGVRADARVAADERTAQVDVVIREAHGQAVTEEGCIRKIAQVHLPAAGLADGAAVVRLDRVAARRLPGRAEGLQRYGRGTRIRRAARTAGVRCGLPALPRCAAGRCALHGQRSQNVLGHAAGSRGLRLLALLRTVFQNGRHGQREQQNGCNDPCQAQPGPCTAAPGAAMRRMIFV